MRQTNRENRNREFLSVDCVRQWERTEIVGLRLWCAPDKGIEQKYCFSGCGVRQTKGENKNSAFQTMGCPRQRERT